MSVFDVLLETEDIVVLGPPTEIDVQVDVGPQGNRGSRFIVGSGDPNVPGVVPLGANPATGDIFVNASTAVNYGWLYIYEGNAWSPALRLQPAVYSNNISVLFNEGEAQVSIPLANIVPDVTVLDVEKYIIQATTNSNNPVSLSISSKIIQGPTLIFTLKGSEYSGGTSYIDGGNAQTTDDEYTEGIWNDLDGTIPLEITITVI